MRRFKRCAVIARHERNLQLFSGATRNIGDCCAAREAESQSARAAGSALADRADAHRDKGHDDVLHSGSTVRHGEASGVVIATGTHTYFGRTVQLVESARPKLHSEAVITRLVKWMCAIVGALVATTWVVSQARGIAPSETLPIALVLMMGAVPVALPAMLTGSMGISSIALARRGVLITRLNAVEDAATMDVLCADKTGTLTMTRLSFGGIAPQPGFDSEDVIRAGALASNAANADPIDRAFLQEASARGILEKTA